ncbi:MAG: glycosyltransferase [Alistipes sp.]|nr:glycosyltransferase [Alistipes sp.]
MTEPLVSVVVPVYDMERFIAETLDSVLASDYPNFEVVVVDDGSTDGSAAILDRYAARDSRIRVLRQPNGGVCRARNHAVSEARGEFILPVDSDDRISPTVISDAVAVMEADPDVRVVVPRAEFFGDRTGEWHLPDYSPELLARKNMIPISALYRREDWVRVGGYCEDTVAREDWIFWISVLADGGRVVRLPETGLYYRVREGSKRKSDRKLKRKVIEVLNRRNPEFFERCLGGPLRYRRTWSRMLNRLYRLLHPRRVFIGGRYSALEYFVRTLPAHFRNGDGRAIHLGRNELREFEVAGTEYVVKSFRKPNIINRIVYGLFRSSKAQRSYENAELLLSRGIGTPEPVAWMTERCGLFFTRSYYVCRKSECPHTYVDLIGGGFPQQEEYLRAIARTTAALHELGLLHKDYSRGNILFGRTADGSVRVEIVDLNRIYKYKSIDIVRGCANFAERLPATDSMRAVMAEEYARTRGFDPAECLRLMFRYNVEKK